METGTPFDVLQSAVFETTKAVFGYECSWTAQDKGGSYSGKVHFSNPTEALRTIGVEYDPTAWEMEYKDGDFPGLKERVDRRDSKERVNIAGTEYWVKQILTKFDGKTFVASLKPVVE